MGSHSFVACRNFLAAIACCMAFVCGACAAAGQYPLITERQSVPPEIEEKIKGEKGMFRAAKRVVKVDLLDRISAEGMLSTHDELVLNLFDDAQYRAAIVRISKNVQDTIIIRGRLASFSSGYVVISSNAGRSAVHVRIPEKNREYVILYDSETAAHYLLDIDPAGKEILPGGPALNPGVE